MVASSREPISSTASSTVTSPSDADSDGGGVESSLEPSWAAEVEHAPSRTASASSATDPVLLMDPQATEEVRGVAGRAVRSGGARPGDPRAVLEHLPPEGRRAARR